MEHFQHSSCLDKNHGRFYFYLIIIIFLFNFQKNELKKKITFLLYSDLLAQLLDSWMGYAANWIQNESKHMFGQKFRQKYCCSYYRSYSLFYNPAKVLFSCFSNYARNERKQSFKICHVFYKHIIGTCLWDQVHWCN